MRITLLATVVMVGLAGMAGCVSQSDMQHDPITSGPSQEYAHPADAVTSAARSTLSSMRLDITSDTADSGGRVLLAKAGAEGDSWGMWYRVTVMPSKRGSTVWVETKQVVGTQWPHDLSDIVFYGIAKRLGDLL